MVSFGRYLVIPLRPFISLFLRGFMAEKIQIRIMGYKKRISMRYFQWVLAPTGVIILKFVAIITALLMIG